MAQAITVYIGGREYNLRGDDEKLTQAAAAIVDKQLLQFETRHFEEADVTVSILAALNIAEMHLKNQQQRETDKLFVASEIGKMSEVLEKLAT
jgi:cell division protein ZapA (FtsZ GTPase activity inhibitor)